MATRKLIQQNTDGTKSEYAGKITSAGASDSGEFVVLDSYYRSGIWGERITW